MEDARDFLTVAGSNGTMRRLTLSFSDYKGMEDFERIPCINLNDALSNRVLALHTVFRNHYPKKLKFTFGPNIVNDGDNPCHLAGILHANADVHAADLPLIFTGDRRAGSSTDPALLTLLKSLAKETALRTLTEYDSTPEQETRNLISLIGQKSAEMSLVNILITKDVQEIGDFFDDIFNHDGTIALTEVDIREGAHLIDVSRSIYERLVEANEFEKNFCSKNCRIPKTYFGRKSKSLCLNDKAEIFAVHYISKSKALAKTIHQGLKRNHSFKAFGIPFIKVIDKLKTRKLVELYSLDELDSSGRQKKKYRISYNSDDAEHTLFLERFQALYPGEVL